MRRTLPEQPELRQQFRLLGPLEVRSPDGWTTISAAKWRSVLACLLLRAGQIVPSETLINELWGDSPPPTAANLVSIYAHRLRGVIGDDEGRTLIHRKPGYMLKLNDGDTDLHQFESLVADGRLALAAGDIEAAAALLADAEGLWRGGFLADVAQSPLIFTEARRAAELRLTAAELRIKADLTCGRYAQAVPVLRTLVERQPLHEGLWLLLMRALEGAGRRTEALDVYSQAREVIAEKLGVDPGSDLRREYAELLATHMSGDLPPTARVGLETSTSVTRSPGTLAMTAPDEARNVLSSYVSGKIMVGASPTVDLPATPEARSQSSSPPLPAQLPADIGDFTGRDLPARRLCDMLAQQDAADSPGAVRMVVVAGVAGVGKTALALHVAHQVRDQFPDGQLYATLSGTSASPVAPGEILARFLRDLGVNGDRIPANNYERAALYRTLLSGRRVLILLDNAKDAAQVRPLLPGCSSCAVLVTTRNRALGLGSALSTDLSVLSDPEALELFTRIVGDDRPTAEADATAEVLLACAGLPLAIRICAARLAAHRQWPIATLAGYLRDERCQLDELRTGDMEVRASFQMSYDSLRYLPGANGIDSARAFCFLGLWEGQEPTISLHAAAALLGLPEEGDKVADVLEKLMDAHLVESPAPGEYQLHHLLRVYARERAEDELTEQERISAVSRLHNWRHNQRAVTTPDRPSALSAHSDAQAGIRDQSAHGTFPSSRNPDSNILAATARGRGSYRKGQQRTPGKEHNDLEIKTGEPIGGEIKVATSLGVGPPGNESTENGMPRTIPEPLLAMLHRMLAAHGITGREQAAVFCTALIRSWPENLGYAAETRNENPREITDQAASTPVPAIPDAPGYQLHPDPLGTKTPAEFVRALARLRQWAGNPPFREMEKRCGHEVASATICTALSSDRLPSQRVVLAIITACGGDEDQKRSFITAWRQLAMSQETGQGRRRKRMARQNLYPIPDTA